MLYSSRFKSSSQCWTGSNIRRVSFGLNADVSVTDVKGFLGKLPFCAASCKKSPRVYLGVIRTAASAFFPTAIWVDITFPLSRLLSWAFWQVRRLIVPGNAISQNEMAKSSWLYHKQQFQLVSKWFTVYCTRHRGSLLLLLLKCKFAK